MGTWIDDKMQGPGQFIYPKYRYHGHWEKNMVDILLIFILIFDKFNNQ